MIQTLRKNSEFASSNYTYRPAWTIGSTECKCRNSIDHGVVTRARIRGPFDGKIIPLEDNETIIHKVKTSVGWRAA
jgi:hypothetical protein